MDDWMNNVLIAVLIGQFFVIFLLLGIIFYQRRKSRKALTEELLQDISSDCESGSDEDAKVASHSTQESNAGYQKEEDEGNSESSNSSLATNDNDRDSDCVKPSFDEDDILDGATDKSATSFSYDRSTHKDGPPDCTNVGLSNLTAGETDVPDENKDLRTCPNQNHGQNEFQELNGNKEVLDYKNKALVQLRLPLTTESTSEKTPDENPDAPIFIDTGQKSSVKDISRPKVWQAPYEKKFRNPIFSVSDLNLSDTDRRKAFTESGSWDERTMKIFDDSNDLFFHPLTLQVPLLLSQTWAVRFEEDLCRVCGIYPHNSKCVKCGLNVCSYGQCVHHNCTQISKKAFIE